MTLQPHSLLLTICEVMNVQLRDVQGQGRTQELNDARQAYYWIMRRHTRTPQRAVAKFVNRTHGSAIAGARAAQHLIDTNKHYRSLLNAILDRHNLPHAA